MNADLDLEGKPKPVGTSYISMTVIFLNMRLLRRCLYNNNNNID